MQDAKLYAQSNGVTRRHAEQLLQEFVPRMQWACEEAAGEKAAALDVGCGPGDLTAEILLPRLPPAAKALVGADLCSDMVKHASARYKDQRLRFVQNDIATSDIYASALGKEASAVGGFCKVFSFYTLHWIQDQRAALGNIHGLLREGGEAFLCFLSHSPIFTAYELLMRHPRWGKFMTDAKQFSSPYQHSIDAATTFSSALYEAGFNVKYCCNHSFKHHFESIEGFIGLVESVNPFVRRVPKEDKAAFMEAMVSAVQKAVQDLNKGGEDDVSSSTLYHFTLVAHVEKKHELSRNS